MPTLSVEAVQDRLICALLAAVADSPVGAVGAIVSVELPVVALTLADWSETLLAASRAVTV